MQQDMVCADRRVQPLAGDEQLQPVGDAGRRFIQREALLQTTLIVDVPLGHRPPPIFEALFFDDPFPRRNRTQLLRGAKCCQPHLPAPGLLDAATLEHHPAAAEDHVELVRAITGARRNIFHRAAGIRARLPHRVLLALEVGLDSAQPACIRTSRRCGRLYRAACVFGVCFRRQRAAA